MRRLLSVLLAGVLAVVLATSPVLARTDLETTEQIEEFGRFSSSLSGMAPESGVGEAMASSSSPAIGQDVLQLIASAITGEIAYQHVHGLSVGIGARVAAGAAEYQAALYVQSAFAGLGYDVTLQNFSYWRSNRWNYSQNVVATKPGAGPGILILGAHYDSVSVGKGAGDNASGVGVMLEVARFLAGYPNHPELVFIAFGAEEVGLRGSGYYASQMTAAEVASTIAMINLDMVGIGEHFNVYRANGGPAWVKDLALEIGWAMGHDIRTTPDVYWKGATGDWSDHVAFKQRGIPVAYFEWWYWGHSDVVNGRELATGQNIYHTSQDTIARVSQFKLEATGEVVAALIWELGIDIVAPETVVTAGPTSWIAADSASFEWTGSDNFTAAPDLVYSYSLDGETWSDYSPATSLTVAELADGIYTLRVKARDLAGHEDPTPAMLTFGVDTATPEVKVVTPADGGVYLLGEAAIAAWTAADAGSGLAVAEGTVASGSPLDTTTPGDKTFAVFAEDSVGNRTEVTVAYSVRYAFEGVLRPIERDGSSVFKLGSTVPVKFQLRDAGGGLIGTAVATVLLQKLNGDVAGGELEAVPACQATDGDLFRYDPKEGQYVFNLSTRNLTRGTWRITVELDDGAAYTVDIGLR